MSVYSADYIDYKNVDLETVKQYLATDWNCFAFDYNGVPCGVDPISPTQYNIWYGDDNDVVHSFDEVFSVPFWDNKTIPEIFDAIDITEL